MAGAGKAERTNLSFHDFQRVVTALRPPVEQQTHGQREKERGRTGENGQKRAKEWPPTCHPPPPAATRRHQPVPLGRVHLPSGLHRN